MRWFVLFLLPAFLLGIPSADGLETPNVTFIPATLSPNSPFLAIVDGEFNDSVRITWFVGGVDSVGLFPRNGDMFSCYFSNTDPLASCGPTPFEFSTVGSTPYSLVVHSFDRFGYFGDIEGKELEVNVGGMELVTKIKIDNNTVSMNVFPSGGLAESVSYAVYYKENLSLLTPGYIELSDPELRHIFVGNVSLPGGEYYIAFSSSSKDNFGGELVRISIPLESEGIGPSLLEGEYILTSDGVDVSGLLINPGQEYSRSGFMISNEGLETLDDLSFRVPSGISSTLKIEFEDENTIAPNSSLFFEIKLQNVQMSLFVETSADILSGSDVVGKVPLNLDVNIVGGTIPGKFSIQPASWVGDFALGVVNSKEFTITNNEDEPLTDFGYSFTGDIGNIATVELPSIVSANDLGTMEVSLDPLTTGNYKGSIIVKCSAGSQSVSVDVGFFGDISTQLESLEDEFESLKPLLSSELKLLLSGTLSDIEDLISDANSRQELGDYKGAEKAFVQAQAQVSVLSDLKGYNPSPTPTGDGDSTGIIIIVVIIVAVVGVFFFLKKKKKGKGIEEELDEELEEAMT